MVIAKRIRSDKLAFQSKATGPPTLSASPCAIYYTYRELKVLA